MKFLSLALSLAFALVISSCVKPGELKDDDQNVNTVTQTFQALYNATKGVTPDNLKKNEQVYFYTIAKTYTNEYSTVGVEDYKILNIDYNGSFTDGDGKVYKATDIAVAHTDYSLPTNENPTPTPVKTVETDSQIVPFPYLVWTKNSGSVPPYQDYWLYNGFQDNGEKLFYNLKTYDQVESLPQKLVDDHRCYGFADCKITLHYVEFDIYAKNEQTGKTQRYHMTNSFSGLLPYMASNPKQCLETLVTVTDSHGNNIEVPYQVCRLLVDFVPGDQ